MYVDIEIMAMTIDRMVTSIRLTRFFSFRFFFLGIKKCYYSLRFGVKHGSGLILDRKKV